MVVNEEHEFEELFNEASIFLSKYEKKDIELCLEAISKDFNVTIKNGKLLSKEWGESSFIYEQILKIVMTHLFSGEFNSDGFTKAIKSSRQTCRRVFSVGSHLSGATLLAYSINGFIT